MKALKYNQHVYELMNGDHEPEPQLETDQPFTCTLSIGHDHREIYVTYNQTRIVVRLASDDKTVIVRGEAHNERGESLPLRMHGATDIRNQIEFHLMEANEY